MLIREPFLLFFLALTAAAQTVPGTRPLTGDGDQAALMLDGIHSWLDRGLAQAPARREALPPAAARLALAEALGAHQQRAAFTQLDLSPAIGSAPGLTIHRAQWPVLFEAGAELTAAGLYLIPTAAPRCQAVVLPDASETPEQHAGLAPGLAADRQFALRLAASGCAVLVPALIDRNSALSGAPGVKETNQTHREFIHRMAYQMGRHIIGYEVQKALAAVDWMTRTHPQLPTGILGYGEGGLLALYAAALDQRLTSITISGYFGPREQLWQEPLYRNVHGLLLHFGDAELARLIAPRALVVEAGVGPVIDGPPPATPDRRGAAPGSLRIVPVAQAQAELNRANHPHAHLVDADPTATLAHFLQGLGLNSPPAAAPPATTTATPAAPLDPATRHRRQFAQMVAFTQALVRAADQQRAHYWREYNPAQPATAAPYQARFADWIGILPVTPSTQPVLTRLAYDTPAFRGYEVKLPVTGEVFAYGILLLPKDLKPGERRPVVVAQHGLEGRPQLLIDPLDNARERETYRLFAAQLAERGYIVYAPQNPYLLGDRFRQAQRKANPLGLSLFSFVVAQHRRTLDWLKELPMVDPARIGFYGLSYGGFTAMRVPALLSDYAAVISSGNFNEWTWKTTSIAAPFSYMFTAEYEIFEFAQGARFGHAEMARLIAPRPFMIERGHRDGVGIDEWIAYEHAKVARDYRTRGIPERFSIEYFDGPHRINGDGTFRFLDRWLNWTPTSPPTPAAQK
ncbi:MAG: hypothetical protein IPJ98_10275 [Bryobacterales bacterium]|nr:hypothetical protein [Bryobacterales bacterium]